MSKMIDGLREIHLEKCDEAYRKILDEIESLSSRLFDHSGDRRGDDESRELCGKLYDDYSLVWKMLFVNGRTCRSVSECLLAMAGASGRKVDPVMGKYIQFELESAASA